MKRLLLTSLLSLFSFKMNSIADLRTSRTPFNLTKEQQQVETKESTGMLKQQKRQVGKADIWSDVYAEVKEGESLQLQPYTCPGGRVSIGYGHVIRKEEKYLLQGIDENKADSLLAADMGYCRNWVENRLNLKGNQLKAITLFAYAFGTTKLEKSSLFNKIKQKQPIEDELMRWVRIKGKANRNLLKRRKYELSLYNS